MNKATLDEQTVRSMIHEEMTDIIQELRSPKLRRSIIDGRKAYKTGKTQTYDELRHKLQLDK